ncbi:YdcF family protein [Notoacmeibacter ruber]|uniref:YdcF family protein n=1 Tax=Notoacmeibacter ruber TaxID=2670375 RepID=A0A3L7JD73_9HYPH|nr:YdcF family protein [Notoacmeibacter ruber]RLQ88623.1 YdcF family protein [Notoacmeibacter ruber]
MRDAVYPDESTAVSMRRRHGSGGGAVHALARLFTWLLLGAVGALIGGFVFFVYSIGQLESPATFPANAGIVAFTGASGRIEKGLELLAEGRAERLLISGVHPDNTIEDIAAEHRGNGDLFACCIDLDTEALDTAGNARETLNWAREHDFDALIIVTSDWHLPRSLLELRQTDNERRLIGVPVRTDVIQEGLWLSNSGTVRLLVQEYAKYLLAIVRNAAPDSVRKFAAARSWSF